jgi:hypothetical protein
MRRPKPTSGLSRQEKKVWGVPGIWGAGKRTDRALISVDGINYILCLCLWHLFNVVSAATIVSCIIRN